MSVVLDAVPNENYEPSEAEILEYGKWLGMSFPEDNPFLWIAREGLKAPLPEHWKACRSEKGELYYFNFKTGESNWDHPLDEQFRELFKNEKKSPGPQSVAKGAKRLPIDVEIKEESVDGQKKQTDCGSSTSGRNSKVRVLKSLKLKKELPKDLRLNKKAGDNSDFDNNERCLEPIKSGRRMSDNGSSIQRQNTESVSTERSGESLNSAKEEIEADLADQLKQFRSKKLKEHQTAKEEYETRLNDSWNRYQKRRTEEYEKEVKGYKEDLEKKLVNEKSKIEGKYNTTIQKLTEEVEANLKIEAKKIRQFFNEKYDKEKDEVERTWQEKLEDFKKEKALEFDRLSDLNSKTLTELKQSKEEIWETALSFVETYKEANNLFFDELKSTNASFSKHSEIALSELVGHARKLYDDEINVIKESFKSEVEDIKQQFSGYIRQYEMKHKLLLEEKEKYEKEHNALVNARKTLSDYATSKHSEGCTTLGQEDDCQEYPKIEEAIGKGGDFVPETKGNGVHVEEGIVEVRSEKEAFESAVAYLKEVQRKELEDVKRDLKHHAEEELKATLDEVLRERCRLHIEPSPEIKDEIISLHGNGKVFSETKSEEKESEKERLSIAFSDNMQKENLTAVLTDALRTVFAGSPFILPSPNSGGAAVSSTSAPITGDVNGNNENAISNTPSVSTPRVTEMKPTDMEKKMDVFPVSFQEQKILLAGERQRVAEGKRFVENQRLSLEERRYQLKTARHQWKQDVRAAKEDGVRVSSKRGKLLNKIRLTLDNQARGLEHDEAILRDSERWLVMKEQSVYQMEKQINELEEGKGRDTSINSIDTVALMTGFFKPTVPFPEFYPQNHDAIHGVVRKRNLDLVYTKTLDRIARRLEEVTSMMNLQQQKRKFSSNYENLPRRRSGQKLTKGTELLLGENRVL